MVENFEWNTIYIFYLFCFYTDDLLTNNEIIEGNLIQAALLI